MPIRTTKDGRTIRTGKDYTEFRTEVYVHQACRCKNCHRATFLNHPIEWDDSFHIAHRQTRGMGGGFRDDVVGPNKGQVEGGKCGKCHRIEHNQQEAHGAL